MTRTVSTARGTAANPSVTRAAARPFNNPRGLAARWSAVVVAALCSMGPVRASDAIALRGLDGEIVRPLDPSHSADARVVVFVSTTCPVSNRYAPEIGRLRAALADRGVEFWLVYPNPAESPAEIRSHVAAFGHDPAHVLRDPEHRLVRRTTATITPEAVVFDRALRVVYQGRIDDRYIRIGLERPAPTVHDLEDALIATLDGRPVARAVTPAVGCFIADFIP